MGLDGLHFHVDGKHISITHDVVRVASRDVDALIAQPQHRWNAFGRIVSEEKSDRRLDGFAFATRPHVDLQYEIGPGLQSPGEPFRQQWRHLTRRPPEKVSVRKNGRPCQQPVVAGRRICGVELP
jgi:hypothetical protein